MAQAAKIMLVEDDINLSEIYQARMAAEGYTVVSAHDGEEALALAAKEKPDLIIADVMMPKISGFEMLDILRNTEGLQSTKVIMLTALGQAEDKTRAQTLGADRYLVKSQVTLEDIVKNARELLGDENVASASPAAAPAPNPVAVPTPPANAASTPQPAAATPVNLPVSPAPQSAPAPAEPTQPFVSRPVVTPPPVASRPATLVPRPAPTPASVPTTPTPATPTTPPAPVRPAPPSAASAPRTMNNQILTDAVNELLANSPQPPKPQPTQAVVTPTPAPTPTSASTATTPATPPPSTTQPVAPVPDPPPSPTTIAPSVPPAQPTTPPTTPAPIQVASATPVVPPPASTDDSAPVAHKKIIKPIGNPDKKTDLNSLLAAEEAKHPNVLTTSQTMPTAPPTEHQPGNVFTPTAPSAGNNTGIDPSSISL